MHKRLLSLQTPILAQPKPSAMAQKLTTIVLIASCKIMVPELNTSAVMSSEMFTK